jgi:AraC family transcriptional regulator of adaptative response/methylated-DNA-[protein]-cysteine methyltransferase
MRPAPDLTAFVPASLPDDARWDALLARDPAYDGQFYFSVETTGIYCRPSCPARRPKREHVRFHATAEAAERAGFRPCKRCRPDQPSLFKRNADKVAAACRTIAASDEAPDLKGLAAEAGLSPHHFPRLFKAGTGLTPKAYAVAERRRRMRTHLPASASVTAAIYEAGFGSAGRFYERSAEMLGMTPSTYRAGAPDERIGFAIGACSIGLVLAAATDRGICAILFGDDRKSLERDLRKMFPRATIGSADSSFQRTLERVIAFIEAPATGLELPLDVRGTAFQHRVWQALCRIPSGATASYAEVAEAIGAPDSARAVARACASNRIAVAIPCHRVVRSDGSISGYRGGVARKRALLARETKL